MELYNTAASFSPSARDELRGQLVCYARSVISDDWRTMRSSEQNALVQRWIDASAATIGSVDVEGGKQTFAYEHWVITNAARAEARRGRFSEAMRIVPPPLWLFVVLGGLLTVTYMCFYSDSGERFVVQALMIGSVTAIVTASLLVVHFLDSPLRDRP